MELNNVEKQLKNDLSLVKSSDDLEKINIVYLGRNGVINNLLSKIKTVSPNDKQSYGQKVNNLKNIINELIKEKRNELLKKEDEDKYLDVTLPGKKYPRGSFHPSTIAIAEISRIFEKIGFARVSYPEVEWEYFSFEALNMPKGHPARDDFETFFVDSHADPQYGKMVLTPHTSSGQIREMGRSKPPIRMINIAKTYRPNWDTSHTPMFHQFEGLCIDRDINITHLKGTINYFVKNFFGEEKEIRLRPFHFQFTEPSFEIDITCDICKGTGIVNNNKCKLCKSGWLELGGSGMVHPNVLKSGGVDPNIYSGWAFGFGVERVLMMKEGFNLDDLRIMYSGDIRFLEQF